jgi:hypothetical protein
VPVPSWTEVVGALAVEARTPTADVSPMLAWSRLATVAFWPVVSADTVGVETVTIRKPFWGLKVTAFVVLLNETVMLLVVELDMLATFVEPV